MSDAEWMERGAGISLAAVLPEARFVGCDDVVASRFTADARRCRSGDVFVAVLGENGDGHEQVARAIAQGAAAIVAERMVPTHGVPLCLVSDSAWSLARLAHAVWGDPADQLRIVAVTGTSGKTTTAWLAASVLAEAGLRVGILSDLGCLDAEDAIPEPADLAQPAVLAEWLHRLVASGCTHAVVEVSGRMLATRALAGIRWDAGVVTSLASGRADVRSGMRACHAVHDAILAGIAPDGCLIYNADDPRVRRLAARHDGCTMAVGLRSQADVSAVPVERSLAGQTVLLTAGNHAAAVALEVPTAAFARDALCAAAVGLRQRIPLERVTRGLEAAGSVPGRLERIDRGQAAAVFIDQPTSGHALAATLASLRRLTTGRLVLIAEDEAAAAFGPRRRFALRAGRWCDISLVVPATVLDEHADRAAVAAYARIDRLLAEVGRDDCVIVLGRPLQDGGSPGDPGEPMAIGTLATLVDGWLRLSHPPTPGWGRAA